MKSKNNAATIFVFGANPNVWFLNPGKKWGKLEFRDFSLRGGWEVIEMLDAAFSSSNFDLYLSLSHSLSLSLTHSLILLGLSLHNPDAKKPCTKQALVFKTCFHSSSKPRSVFKTLMNFSPLAFQRRKNATCHFVATLLRELEWA